MRQYGYSSDFDGKQGHDLKWIEHIKYFQRGVSFQDRYVSVSLRSPLAV